MNGFRLFGKPVTLHHLAYLAGFVIWLLLVFLLPRDWSNFIGAIGLLFWGFLYMRWAVDPRVPMPKWGSFISAPLEPFQIDVDLIYEKLDKARSILARLPDEVNSLTSREWGLLHILLILYNHFPEHRGMMETEVISILAMLHLYGDTAELSSLELLVKTVAELKTGERGVVQEAANACLPILMRRWQRIKVGSALLRPAARSDAPDELLRPATGGVETDPATLLRPTVKDMKT